jgi:iron complex transport system substrate-binding protein
LPLVDASVRPVGYLKKNRAAEGGTPLPGYRAKRKKRRRKLSLREGLRGDRRRSSRFIRDLLIASHFFLLICPGAAIFAGENSGADAARPPAEGRIVSLTPGVTETLFALGVGPRVAGVSRYCDYPPEATTLPQVGSFLAPVVEAVVALRPGLVLTSPSPGNRESVATLERVGLRVVAVPEGSTSVAGVLDSIRDVATAVGADAAGLVDKIEVEIAAAAAKVVSRPRVKVAIVVGHDPLVLAGPDSYLGDLVERVGGENVATEVGGKWPRVGLEFLIATAPEAIVDLGMGSEASTGRGRWSRFAEVPAVRDDRIYFDPSLVLLHPGPRLGSQAAILARMLHPEAWQENKESIPD